MHVLNISETLADGGFQCVVNTTSTKKNLTFKLIFDPPITVRLEVTLPYGWRFHQVHYCVPIVFIYLFMIYFLIFIIHFLIIYDPIFFFFFIDRN